MKLRRIGNSLGTTFSRETLVAAHIDPDDELEIVAGAGEIRIKKAKPTILLELSTDEVALLSDIDKSGKEWRSIIKKAIASIGNEKK